MLILRERVARVAIVASWVALCAGITTTFGATHWLRTEEASRAAERFDQRVTETIEAIKDRLNAYEQVLRGGVGLFAASHEVTRSDWRAYVESLRIEQRYPGIGGIGYGRIVPPAELARHVRQVRSAGYGEYGVRPVGGRDLYSPVVYIEPFNARNARAFGYDMLSEPVRRSAMERARDESVAAISGKVTLVQEGGADVQPGFLMFLPVYRNGEATDTVAARRAALAGYVYSPFRMNEFMSGLLGGRGRDVAIEIFDGDTTAAEARMYAIGEIATANALTRIGTLNFNDHPWTVRVHALPTFEAQRDWQRPALVLALGVAASLLLWLVLRAMAETQVRAVRLAARITTALRESEHLHRLILDTTHDAFIEMDADGKVIEWNREAAAMFGWARADAIGRLVSDLIIPPAQRPAHARGLRRYLDTGESGLLNRRMELAALDRNGRQFPVEVTIVPVTLGGKQIFSAFLRDISERVKSELRLHESLAELKRSNGDLEQFAYIASHDLQEPLRAVTGCIQLLERRNRDRFDEPSRDLFSHAVTGAQRMRKLIDDLLIYSRVHSRARPPERVDTEALVVQLLSEQALIIAERQARVSLGDLPVVTADATQLRQVFQNLISNALKFCDTGKPEVTISAERRGDDWVFAVKDNGIGIESEYYERVFVAFQRLHTRDEYPGSGIGLAVCKKVIERHGGRVWVESEPRRGSIFYFTLPAVESAVAEEVA